RHIRQLSPRPASRAATGSPSQLLDLTQRGNGVVLAVGARMRKPLVALSVAVLGACAGQGQDAGENPFTADMSDSGKEDSAYMNPDGIEVEVDLEGDVEGSSFQIKTGPVEIGQFALTYFRKQETMFIESLAEDGSAPDRTEWL